MTLNEIMAVTSRAYDADGVVLACWDPVDQRARRNPRHGYGDTLAVFICREIAETYDPGATSVEQLAEAARVIQRAAAELTRITSSRPSKDSYFPATGCGCIAWFAFLSIQSRNV